MYIRQELEQQVERNVFIALALVVSLSLASFGYQGYSFYQRILELSRPAIEIEGVDVSNVIAVETPTIPMTEVVSVNLFGLYQEVDEAEPAPVLENLLETTLQLTLQGAFTHSDISKSRAIINSMERPSNNPGSSGEHYYFVNDVLPGNALLYAVNKDSVILKRGDVYETLHFPGYATPIIDPTPRPQNMANQIKRASPVTFTSNETLAQETSAATPSPNDANYFDVNHSIQDRLARLRAQ